jgi:hypothetical protein
MSGVRKLSAFKQSCRQYENYMAAFYGFEVVKNPAALLKSCRPPRSRYTRGSRNSFDSLRLRLMAQQG